MRLEVWLPIYRKILRDMEFDEAADMESARRLAVMMGAKGASALDSVREGFPERVLICGGSASLPDELSSLHVEGYVVAADSATTVLHDAGIRPSMVVTDLDGIVEDQIEANSEGSVVFVHAHGDNMSTIEKYLPEFTGHVVGTCQCEPVPGLFNFGGFTDGDRAACICAELGARKIVLAGFDFYKPSDKTGKSRSVKQRKLLWAKTVLETLASSGVQVVQSPRGRR